MGRSPCCDGDANVKKGPWTVEEDDKLRAYVGEKGAGNWRNLPKLAGLNRCGKSCRLRWQNYLRPDVRRGKFSAEEDQLIIHSHSLLGNKWSAIASRLPGRTDNEIKNYWNTHLRKKLLKMGIDPQTHAPITNLDNLLGSGVPNLLAVAASLGNLLLTANPLINAQLLQTLIQLNGSLMSIQNPHNNLHTSGTLNNYGNSNSGIGISIGPPALVSASPENSIVDHQVQEPVDARNVSISSPTSKPLAAWDGLNLGELDTDLGWKDILNHISWSDACSVG